jgi:tetratricopeptide (TPR) repeat protein
MTRAFVNPLKKLLLLLFLGAACGLSVSAQVTVRGQIFLPSGTTPSNPIQFDVNSDDGTINDIRFTDSNGRFILERLSTTTAYRLTFHGNGVSYGDTVYLLRPGTDSTPRITLNDLPAKKPPTRSPDLDESDYKRDPKVTALYDKAMKAIEAKQFSAAEPYLRQATEADPKFARAWNALGGVLMQERKFADAENPLRHAVEVDPKFIRAQLNLGIVLNSTGKFAEAIAPLREALRLRPDLGVAHQHLGIALVETDQFPEAEEELKKALASTDADEVIVQLYLGKLYARTGDFEKSIAAFNIYLQKAPGASNAAEVRGLIDRMKKEMAARR